MPSAIGSNGNSGFAPQQTQIALSSSFSDIQLLSNFDAMELQGHVFIDAASDYRASFKLSIIKNGAGVYEIAASDIAGDDYLGSPIMSFQISGNYLQCKSDVPLTVGDSAYVKFNIDTPSPALVGSSSLSVEGSNIVSTVPSNRLPAGQYPGADGSSAIAAGYVGETIELSFSYAYSSNNSWRADSSTSMTLSPGVWMITVEGYLSAANQVNHLRAGLSTDSNNTADDLVGNFAQIVRPATTTLTYGGKSATIPFVYNISTTTTLYGKFFLEDASTFTATGKAVAIRIA